MISFHDTEKCYEQKSFKINIVRVHMRFQSALTSEVIGERNEWFFMLRWTMIPGDEWGAKSFRHLSYSRRKTSEKSQPGKLIWPGVGPGPARWEPKLLHVEQTEGRFKIKFYITFN